MCGISCFVQINNDHAASHERIQLENHLHASLDLINHRGPDSRGHWISQDNRVALGHVRLSINDLSPAGFQPFHSADDAIHAVVNGELYDHEKIRDELLSKPDFHGTFKGHCDCEIVVALYQYYGLGFLTYLRGEFALCLWDEREQLFIAARDRYGIKPLFWKIEDHTSGRGLLVAAEAKAFIPFGWKPEWDVRSLKEGGWNHDERTLFQGVNKVRPGHYMTCRSGHVEQHPYWDIEYPDKRVSEPRTVEEMIEGVRSRLLEAVRLRLRADVPVGVYLSGGIDSSAVAGMMTHLVRERGERLGNEKETDRISCFSVAFDKDSGYDESDIANRTAEFLGVKFYKKHMDESELAARFEEATWHCEHHSSDLNYVGKFALSELPSQLGFKVVLTGEGADENFAGYPLYFPDHLREHDYSWPADQQLPEDERQRYCAQRDLDTETYYNSIGADGSNRGPCVPRRMMNNITTISSMAAFSPSSLFADWTCCYGICDNQSTIANNIDGQIRDKILQKWHPLNSAMYVWSKGHLANLFLSCLGDRTEMAHSLEARTPFLDHKLTEYVNGLPPSLKVRWVEDRLVEKWILREAAKPFITTELYKRAKHPFSAPTNYPPNGPLHKLLKRLITRDNVGQLGFLDWQKVECLLNRAFNQQDLLAMRFALIAAQWVVISQRFEVKKASAPMVSAE